MAEKHEKEHAARHRKKRQRRLANDLLLDYAKNSTLHGLRYIGERRLTTLERIFWLATFIASLSLCGYHISNVYVKWRTSPVIVSINEKMIPVGMVPFPSVTICPQIKSKVSVYNFSDVTNHAENLTDEESNKYDSLVMVCNYRSKSFNEYYNITNYTKADEIFTQTILDVAPTMDDTIFLCTWIGMNLDIQQNCSKLFKRVLTAEGVCFNFNGVSAEELFRDNEDVVKNINNNFEPSRGWAPEIGYDYSIKNPFPYRGKENSFMPDLKITVLSNAKESDGVCNRLYSGYRVYLHNPADLPQSSLYYYGVVKNEVASLAVNLNILTTSDTLRSYTPDVRQCYFPGEKYLRFFKIYTAKNCRLECLTNITYNECGCVQFYMPRNASTHICRNKDKDCTFIAHQKMVARELEYNINNVHNGDVCRCLPACNSVEYEAESLKTGYKFDVYFGGIIRSENYTRNETVSKMIAGNSKIEVYFKNSEYISMRRSELFGWTDFVANIGGLLGVFLGFSFLSLVELLYFLTLRIGFTLKSDLEEKKRPI